MHNYVIHFDKGQLPPVISNIPAPIIIEATSSTGAIVSYNNPTATDAEDGTVAISCTPPSGSTFQVGQSNVNCAASDAARNRATATFTITVTPLDSDDDGVADSQDNCPELDLAIRQDGG